MSHPRKTDKIINLLSIFLFFLSFLGIIYLIMDNKNQNRQPIIVKSAIKHSILAKEITPTETPLPAYFKIPILVYHYVEIVKDPKDTIRKSLDTPPIVLENQLKTLISDQYRFVTLSDISDYLDGRKTAPSKAVAITFDDGYRDFYTDVFPILEKYHVRATAYIVPGFINQQNNLTSSDLKVIANSGLVEIGAHTIDHRSLTGLNKTQEWYEIYQSKVDL